MNKKVDSPCYKNSHKFGTNSGKVDNNELAKIETSPKTEPNNPFNNPPKFITAVKSKHISKYIRFNALTINGLRSTFTIIPQEPVATSTPMKPVARSGRFNTLPVISKGIFKVRSLLESKSHKLIHVTPTKNFVKFKVPLFPIVTT